MFADNSFVTLTYDDDHLPDGGSLCLRDFQLFLKRLRRFAAPDRVRFFHCGEYGEKFSRAHYHALLFGFDFADKRRVEDSFSGHPQWMSEELDDLWSAGRATIGTVNFESAAYVARYVTKKVTGEAAKAHYTRVSKRTGEVVELRPEYATMSRRPGIGFEWFRKFATDVYPSDEVITRGKSAKPPRYYDHLYAVMEPELFEEIRKDRARARRREDESPARLAVREECTTARVSRFRRRLENA